MRNKLLYQTRGLTLSEKIDRLGEVDDEGHTKWLGTYGTSGSPVVADADSNGRNDLPASHVIFSMRAGRAPVGIVKADCGVRGCLTAGHLMDELDRRKVRLQVRALSGRKAPWDVCRHGHDWDTYGRVTPALKLYCDSCATARVMAARKARKGTQ